MKSKIIRNSGLGLMLSVFLYNNISVWSLTGGWLCESSFLWNKLGYVYNDVWKLVDLLYVQVFNVMHMNIYDLCKNTLFIDFFFNSKKIY